MGGASRNRYDTRRGWRPAAVGWAAEDPRRLSLRVHALRHHSLHDGESLSGPRQGPLRYLWVFSLSGSAGGRERFRRDSGYVDYQRGPWEGAFPQYPDDLSCRLPADDAC